MFVKVLRLCFSTLALVAMMVACAPAGDEAAKEAEESVVTLKTNRGDIVLRFFPDIAPEHVKNFISHSESGLYTGTLFHRVIPGFMVQGGDPNSKDDNPANDGQGGYSYKGEGTDLPAEFNDRKHDRGILSMARSNDPNSAGSQFFICHGSPYQLDGKYTVFGEVIDGIDVVDKIAAVKRNPRDRPDRDQKIEEILVEQWPIKLVEESRKAMWAEDKAEK